MLAVGHAFFPEFGMKDSDQISITDFSKFNKTKDLIVLGPVYNTAPVSVNISEIENIHEYAKIHKHDIDEFLKGQIGLSDLKNIIYTYVNQTAKAKQLDRLGSDHFFNWIKNSRVSQNKQTKIFNLNQLYNNVLEKIFTIVKQIQKIKDSGRVEIQHLNVALILL